MAYIFVTLEEYEKLRELSMINDNISLVIGDGNTGNCFVFYGIKFYIRFR